MADEKDNVLIFDKEKVRIAGRKAQQNGTAIPDTPQFRAGQKILKALEEEGCYLNVSSHLQQIGPGLYQSVPKAEIRLKGT